MCVSEDWIGNLVESAQYQEELKICDLNFSEGLEAVLPDYPQGYLSIQQTGGEGVAIYLILKQSKSPKRAPIPL